MIWRIINRLFDLAFLRAAMPLWLTRCNGRVTVFLYHRVDEPGENAFLDEGGSPTISRTEFEADLLFLKNNKFEFLTVAQLGACQYLPDKRYAVITFDDGFSSVYTRGAPVAESLGVPLTIFQCSSMLQPCGPIWEHVLYWLNNNQDYREQFTRWTQKYVADLSLASHSGLAPMELLDRLHKHVVSMAELQSYLDAFLRDHPDLQCAAQDQISTLYPTDNQLRAARRAGHEIGSHGDRHYRRDTLTATEFANELERSKNRLEKIIDAKVESFSYPFNSYYKNDQAICSHYYKRVATVDGGRVTRATSLTNIPRNTHPGSAKNVLRHRRWLLTGAI